MLDHSATTLSDLNFQRRVRSLGVRTIRCLFRIEQNEQNKIRNYFNLIPRVLFDVVALFVRHTFAAVSLSRSHSVTRKVHGRASRAMRTHLF